MTKHWTGANENMLTGNLDPMEKWKRRERKKNENYEPRYWGAGDNFFGCGNRCKEEG